MWPFKKKCKHEFKLDDIKKTNIPELKPPKTNGFSEWSEYYREIYTHESHTKRIQGTCHKCGGIEYAHCGVDLKGKLV